MALGRLDHPLNVVGMNELFGDANRMQTAVPAQNGGDVRMRPVQPLPLGNAGSSANEQDASDKETSGSEGVAPNIF
jgi:hypothetical protein